MQLIYSCLYLVYLQVASKSIMGKLLANPGSFYVIFAISNCYTRWNINIDHYSKCSCPYLTFLSEFALKTFITFHYISKHITSI